MSKPKTPKPRPFARLVFDQKADFRYKIMVGDMLLVELFAGKEQAKERLNTINTAFEAAHAERCAMCNLKKIAARASFEKFCDERDIAIARKRLAETDSFVGGKKLKRVLAKLTDDMSGLGEVDEDVSRPPKSAFHVGQIVEQGRKKYRVIEQDTSYIGKVPVTRTRVVPTKPATKRARRRS